MLIIELNAFNAHAQHALNAFKLLLSMILMIFSAGLNCVKNSATNISFLVPFKGIGQFFGVGVASTVGSFPFVLIHQILKELHHKISKKTFNAVYSF
jgi:hypothetical protein